MIDVAEPERQHARAPAVECYGALAATLRGSAGGRAAGRRLRASAGSPSCAEGEIERREGERGELEDDREPLHPMRLYAELAEVLERDAIVIGDGGDYVSYAGRVIDSYQPGCWLDPGPFGCLGAGPGYALAAKLARPERQVVLLVGDGAFGFSGMEFDTLARHGVNVVGVMGNNGIWALEKHPMEFLYGYSVAAELRPETRYDQLVEALGGHGELVRRPAGLRAGARARVRGGKAGAGERADRPERGVPAPVEPRLTAPLSRRPGEAQRSTVEDVVLGDLHLLELEGAEGLLEQDHAGDDRGSAVGIQADDRAAAGFGHVGEAGEQQFDGGELQR